MPWRTQISLGPALDRKAKERARDLGVSFAEYVRRLIDRDLSEPETTPTVSDLVGIGDSGGSDVARNEDEYLAEAFEDR